MLVVRREVQVLFDAADAFVGLLLRRTEPLSNRAHPRRRRWVEAHNTIAWRFRRRLPSNLMEAYAVPSLLPPSAACAAANLAIGTRKGEQDT
jgi:hypothetical protein